VSVIGAVFLAITYLWGVLHFVPVLLLHPFVLLLDPRRRRVTQACGMSWLRSSLLSVGIAPRLHNPQNLPPPTQTVVYVANHASNMDIYLLPVLRRAMKVVCKAEVFRTPVIGWAMAMAGNIGVRRADRRGQLEAFRAMVAALQAGTSLFIYPEGTRSASGRMARWKAGAFRAAIAAGVPVVPVTISGTREMMPADALTPLRYPAVPLSLTVHPAIESLGRSVEELREAAFRSVDLGLEPAFRRSTGAGEAGPA
jgi:1-acyl-sn-glycerol-3-phosphate acyltransferase